MRFHSPSAIGHAYILSSPSREDAVRTARDIASAAVCLSGSDVPCGVCRGCRKAAAGIHPDIITVRRQTDTKGNLRRELTVAQIRELSLDAQVLPNEAERKAYIIEEAELLNTNAQNAALKLLEEPPRTAVFLLCAVNPQLLLETVRSRCQLIRPDVDGNTPERAQERQVAPEAAESSVSEESRALAASFLSAVCTGDRRQLDLWIAKNELSKLDAASAFIDAALEQCTDMVCGRAQSGALSRAQVMHLYRLLRQCADYLAQNVNAKHIFSLLTADSIQTGETL